MKRLHIHLSVNDLNKNIAYYSQLFSTKPETIKADYAKWMLEDPKVNFAISTRSDKIGLDHLGIQVESNDELLALQGNMKAANDDIKEELGEGCCYSVSDKYWSTDPQGIAWEGYHTLDSIPTFNGKYDGDSDKPQSSCCAPKSSCC
jgi:hypothetical protein